jgi:deazaflavin-dependent oxidoreductase (nitroreductase family)
MLLLHHRGRKSQREYVIPLVYLPHDTDPDTVYIIASSYGAPSNPDWYLNLMAAGTATIERDAETYEVTIREVAGEERNRLYLEQARRRSAFIGYAGKTAGVRVIPVLELRRA